jgi:hypothetical protein
MDFGDLKDENAQRALLTQFMSDPDGKFDSSLFGNSSADAVARLKALAPEELKSLYKNFGLVTPEEAPMQREVNRLLNNEGGYAPMKEKPMTPISKAPPGVFDEPKKFDWSRLIGPGVGAGAGFLLGNTLSGLADGEDEEENKRRARRLAVLGALGGGVAGYALT